MAQVSNDPFPAAALEANRAGRLTDDQRRGFAGMERGARKDRIILALMLGVISALIFTSTGGNYSHIERMAVGAAFAAVAVLLFLYGTVVTDSMTRDLRGGKVETIEGAIGKDTYTSNNSHSSMTTYYLEVGRRRLDVAERTYEAAPDAGYVRVYALPRTHRVVNLEKLPDPAVQVPDAASAPGFAVRELRSMAAGWLTGDYAKTNEARAQMEAMGHAFEAQMAANATPPPLADRDPRPLAEAILGKWQTPMMSVAFNPDGTLVATLPGGRQEQGHWSIGPDGKLHAKGVGDNEAADAWVAGDTLTVSDGGRGMAFHRAG